MTLEALLFTEDIPHGLSSDEKSVGGITTKAPLVEDLPALTRLAERLEPALRRAFVAAVRKIQGKIDLEALAAALNANQLTAAEAAAKLATFPEVYGELAAPLRSGFLVGSGLAVRDLAQSGITSSFTLINQQAVEYAERAVLDLVAPFKDNARETIREFLARSLAGEMTPSAAAKDIKDLIGLDPARVRRADKFWEGLVEEGVSDENIARRVGRYMDSLLRERAEVIARNETHKAAAAGQQAAWEAAADAGLIDRTEQSKIWITTWDEVLCDLCEPMDGVAVGLDEAFDTPNGPMDFPSMHVNCRCTATLIKTSEVEAYVDRLNRPEDKPQSRRAWTKGNDCHNPAGSSDGGQFCGDGESGDAGEDLSATVSRFTNTDGRIDGGVKFNAGPVRVAAFRTGDLKDQGRGIFFGDSVSSVAAYVSLHDGAQIEEYIVTAKNVVISDNVFKLHPALFKGKTFQDAVFLEDKRSGFASSMLAARRVEAKIARAVIKLGHDAIIYTKPPDPAKHEIAIVNQKTATITVRNGRR